MLEPETVPTPGIIARVVAPFTFQLSVVLLPADIDAGLAVKVFITGSAGSVTVIVIIAELGGIIEANVFEPAVANPGRAKTKIARQQPMKKCRERTDLKRRVGEALTGEDKRDTQFEMVILTGSYAPPHSLASQRKADP